MAQSRRDSLRSTLAGGHDFVFDICCDLCEGEGQYKEAVGYCSNCREYMCTDCFRQHTRPKPTRHHVLLDQHHMPKDQQQNSRKDSLSSTLRGGSDSYTKSFYTDCFRHITRPKPKRDHVRLDQHQMTKGNQPIATNQKVAVPVSDVEARVSGVSLPRDRDVSTQFYKSNFGGYRNLTST